MLYIEHQALAAPDLYNQLTHQTHQTKKPCSPQCVSSLPSLQSLSPSHSKLLDKHCPLVHSNCVLRQFPGVCAYVCAHVHVFKSKSTSPHNTHTQIFFNHQFFNNSVTRNKNLWIACIHTLYRSHNEVLTAAGCRATSGAPGPVVLVATIRALLDSVAAVS